MSRMKRVRGLKGGGEGGGLMMPMERNQCLCLHHGKIAADYHAEPERSVLSGQTLPRSTQPGQSHGAGGRRSLHVAAGSDLIDSFEALEV